MPVNHKRIFAKKYIKILVQLKRRKIKVKEGGRKLFNFWVMIAKVYIIVRHCASFVNNHGYRSFHYENASQQKWVYSETVCVLHRVHVLDRCRQIDPFWSESRAWTLINFLWNRLNCYHSSHKCSTEIKRKHDVLTSHRMTILLLLLLLV